VALFLALAFMPQKDLLALEDLILLGGPLGPIICVLIYGALGATPIPSEPFTIVISGLFGPLQTLWIACVGNVIAAMLEFYVGSKIGDVADFERRRENFPNWLKKLPIDSPIFLLLGRALPGYGPKTVGIISGVYKVPVWRFLWTAIVANVIGAAILAFGASGLLQLIR